MTDETTILGIRIVRERDADEAFNRQVREGLCVAFPYLADRIDSIQIWPCPSMWRMVLEDNVRIIAHAKVIEREISVGSEDLMVAGVGGVFVEPGSRGRGLSGLVLEKAMHESLRLGLNYGLLFCVPELEKLYARSHWRLLSNRPIIRMDENGHEAPKTGEGIAMYYPLRRCKFPAGAIHLHGDDW